MDILELGAKLLNQHLGGNANENAISGALGQLLGGTNGKLDIASLVAKFASNGGLKNVVSSWLGDGANQGINPSQILDMFGEGKIGSFAQQVGVDKDAAAGGLASVLPKLIDQFSSGGNILESAGGLGGLLGAAKKLF